MEIQDLKPSQIHTLTLNKPKIASFISNKAVLVTGGTGSFGQKFISVLYENFNPSLVVVFSRDEFKQHHMRTVNGFNDKKYPTLHYALGDIRNRQRLYDVLREYNIQIVVHTAAIKHVDICEKNPGECIDTNIIGTINLVGACKDAGVERVLALSTDKCVDPINIYGASKLCLERIVITSNNFRELKLKYGTDTNCYYTNTIFSVARYGNVLGSRGSVVHVFSDQLKNGELKITDESMTRFTLMKEEAVNFAMNCLSIMIGGEVFVPQLLSYNLKQLINIMKPHKDFPVSNIGVRPGEKIHECMVSKHESHLAIQISTNLLHELELQCSSSSNYNKSSGFYVIRHNYYGSCINYQEYYTKLYGEDYVKTCEAGVPYSSEKNIRIGDQQLKALVAIVLCE